MRQKGSLTQQGAGAQQAKPGPSPPEDPSQRELFPKASLTHTALGGCSWHCRELWEQAPGAAATAP